MNQKSNPVFIIKRLTMTSTGSNPAQKSVSCVGTLSATRTAGAGATGGATTPSYPSSAGRFTASLAATADDIVIETLAAEVSERGATRMDDQTSDASMEKRKKDGYF